MSMLKKYFNYYLAVLILVYAFTFFIKSQISTPILLVILLFLPLYILFTKLNSVRIILKLIFLWFMSLVFIVILIKKIRPILPPTEINENKIIGFTQYNGYPFYFDLIIFFLLILLPSLMLYLSLRKKNINARKA
jgi:hypothetical protein